MKPRSGSPRRRNENPPRSRPGRSRKSGPAVPPPVPVLFLALFLAAGGASFAAGQPEKGGFRAPGKALFRPARSDAQILKDLLDHLSWDGRVEAAGVDVRIENGRVLLLGSVPSFTARRAAEMDALRIPGVKSVDNRLQVDPDPGPPTGDAVARRIRMILDWSLEVDDAGEIDVRIAEGRVTLTGSVDALWKKERIGELASIPAGVLRVYNNITVLPSERVADEAIAGRILRAIARTAGGAAGRVSVTVRNGKVVLSGQVPSWAAGQLVLEAALYTGGVVEVENGLQVR